MRGGFGSQVFAWLEEHGATDRLRLIQFGLPDSFVEHASRRKLLDLVGLTAPRIHERLTAVLGGARIPKGSVTPAPRLAGGERG